ncbi:MAG: transglutaminase domain-containing protein, partial [Actinomycetota bacterium]
VLEAIRAGGLSQPPAPFDPGWRFLIVVLCVVLGAGATSLALATRRPKIGVAIPVPIVVGAAILQPPSSAVLASIVATVLLIGALSISFGADLSGAAGTSRSFELRRLAKGGGGLALLLVVLVALSQLGFLFDTEAKSQVIPPQKPEAQPPLSDRVLFTVETDNRQPWRLGVLDVYEDNAWKYPPYDRARLEPVPADGSLGAEPVGADAVETTFEIVDVQGHVIPTLSLAAQLERVGSFAISTDPRTQTLELPDQRASRGMTYTVSAPPPPGEDVLSKAPKPSDEVAPFLEAPEPPETVQNLLARAPKGNLFDRLQFVRNQFYKDVVASGEGEPVDVEPSRVAEMLDGAEATPYEITAAEGLLARWAGVPARLGYGFYVGEEEASGTYEVHPEHGATWLEAYFEDVGWVSIVGKPPRAKPSTSLDEKNEDPEILPSDELALVVHVPVKLASLRLLYEVVRFYVLLALPWVAAVLLSLVFYPGAVKLLRRFLRRYWASKHGVAGRILVTYCEFRDRMRDLSAAHPEATPLEFTNAIDPDEEHWELAWLVTRALWGDLRRDLRTEDAEAAEDLALSVTRRASRAQRPTTRTLAVASRRSLWDPYSREIPNLWPRRRLRLPRPSLRPLFRTLRDGARLVGRIPLVLRRRPRIASGLFLVMLLLASCGFGAVPVAGPAELPDRLVPDRIGRFTIQREPDAEKAFEQVGSDSLVHEGRVYTVRDGSDILATFQAGSFESIARTNETAIRAGITENIGAGSFEVTRIGADPVNLLSLPGRRVLLWFAYDGDFYLLLEGIEEFEKADDVFAAILAYQRGEDITGLPKVNPLLDPRLGGD